MLAALFRLGVALAAVADPLQQPTNALRGHRMPHRMQRRRELGVAFRDPFQRTLRVTQRRRFDQPQQVAQQASIAVNELLAAAARSARTPTRYRSGSELFQAAANRARGDPGRPRHRRNAAIAQRTCLRRRK
jgi:hypothetical protein